MTAPLPDSTPIACDDPGVYRTLLESTRAIPWRIDWATMRFTYIGPQIEELLGWSPSSWLSVNDWADRMHEDDRQKTIDFCVAQSQQGIDHEADYRALTRDGDHVWIRDVVHVVRRPDGSVDSLVGFMFDITARKQAEDKIVQLQRELEVLSYRDSLTGVANRRMFDTLYPVEWAKARATGEPLSLVVIDMPWRRGIRAVAAGDGQGSRPQRGRTLPQVAGAERASPCPFRRRPPGHRQHGPRHHPSRRP
ncbi:MAG: domain S-box-containing protein/diguanylate cyclase protein [Massilia sp.]|nr:domain S-box-containing protein/diguanylate cyclase protein [Massilia sp.]